MSDHTQPMTEAMYYILLSLLTPCHGYGILQRVRKRSRGRVLMGPGTLYGVLTRMQKDGLIELSARDLRRKTYTITDAGRAALFQEYRRLQSMVADGTIITEEDRT